jgi:hypothetical protein
MRRRVKGLIYLLTVIGVLIIGTLIVFRTQSEKIAIRLGDYATARFGRDRNLHIEIGNIGGSLIRDLHLEDVCVSYTGGETPIMLMSVPRVYGSFNAASILMGRVKLDSLLIDSPKVVIPRRPDGSRIYPTGDPPPGPPGESPRFEIARLGVTGASVVLEGDQPRMLSALDLVGSYGQDKDGSSIAVDGCSFLLGKAGRVSDVTGSVHISDDRIEIRDATIATPRSGLSLSGFVGTGSSNSLMIDAVIDSLDLGETRTFYSNGDRTDIGGLSGHVRVSGDYAQLAVDLDIEGHVNEWTFDDLLASLVYEDKTVEIKELTSLLNKTPVTIAGSYELAAPPRYRGVIAFSNLDLTDFIKGTEGDFSSDLTGSISFSGTGSDSEDFRLATWPRLERGRYREWSFDSVGGRVDLDSRSVTLDSVLALVGDARLRTTGPIGFDGNLDLAFVLECPRLEDLLPYHRVEELAGAVSGTGRVVLERGVLDLSVRSVGAQVEYKGTSADSLEVSLDLRKAEGPMAGRSEIFARTVAIGGFKASEFIGDIAVEGTTLTLDRIVFSRANNDLLGVRGEMEVLEAGFDVGLDNVFVELGGFIWENTETVSASYREGALQVGDFELTSALGQVRIRNSSYEAERYSLETELDDFDLGLLREAIRAEIPTGLLNMAFRASGSMDSLVFDVDFDIAQGEIRSVGFESLEGRLSYDSNVLDITRVALSENGGSVSLAGAMPVDLSPANISRLVNAGKAYDLVGDLGSIRIDANDIDISLLDPLLPPVKKLRGFADLTMAISGNKESPTIVTRGRLRDAVYGRTSIGEVEWDLALEDSLLTVTRLAFGAAPEAGEISGEVPIALSIVPFRSELLKRPLDLTVKVDNGNLGLLCEVFPRLKVCSGTYAADLRLGGDVSDPTFHGRFTLTDARLRFEGVAQDLREIFLEVTTDGRRFELVRMIAEDGALSVGGFFVIEGTKIIDWDFDVVLKDFLITEFTDFEAQLSGNLWIKADHIVTGRPIPRIEGSLTVKEGEYSYDLGSGTGEGDLVAPTATPSWVMNISVEVPNDFWIRGDEIEAELQGDLSVKRGREGLQVLGTLRTLRGRFYVYHNAFRINRGEFRFADVKSLKNVYIDLEAQSRVYDEKILLTATGFFDNLNISATSESDWSETQIVEALAFHGGRDSDQEGQGGLFSEAFLRAWGYALANRLGREIEDVVPIDLIGVELGDVGEGDAIGDPRLILGKYVSRGLYLEYEQSLGSLYGDRQRFTQQGLSYPERQLSIEYRFSDRFTIEGETGTVGGLGYFDVDLKFKFGY